MVIVRPPTQFAFFFHGLVVGDPLVRVIEQAPLHLGRRGRQIPFGSLPDKFK